MLCVRRRRKRLLYLENFTYENRQSLRNLLKDIDGCKEMTTAILGRQRCALSAVEIYLS
jgi:hypothetical protein